MCNEYNNLDYTLLMSEHTTIHRVKKEICWTVSNLTTGGNHKQVRDMVDKGIIKALCKVVHPNHDSKVLHHYHMCNYHIIETSVLTTSLYTSTLRKAGVLRWHS